VSKQDHFRAVVAPAVGRSKERYHLAVERPGDRVVIIAEFVNEYHLQRVVRALNGDYAFRLFSADREKILQAAE
jgi:hypothetical protein